MASNSSSNSATLWYTLDTEKVLADLQSNRQQGLSRSEATKRLEQYGPNELEEAPGRSTLVIIWDQFKNIMLLMLILVAIVSLVLDIRSQTFPKDAIAIFAIVILNGILGYLQESRAEKALAALRRLSSPMVRVLRDAKLAEITAKELVPGDLMLLEAGDQVAADGRLIEEFNLQIRESSLTGEAAAVEKEVGQLPEDAALAERTNFVYQGTEVVQGRATVVITGTGMQTELGKIATMLQSVEAEPTPLQRRMDQLGNVLVAGALILVAVVVAIGTYRLGFGAFEELLEVSLSMAVAVVPEGLPAVITVTLAIGTQRMVRRHALIRKLPAVETLGSVTTICSDKTGTLTQNKMVVQAIQTEKYAFDVTGEGYAPTGEFQLAGQTTKPEQHGELQNLLLACVLSNDAFLQRENGEWIILGDPTEGALLSLAGKASIEKDQWSNQLPRVGEFPFSSERKRMSVICQTNGYRPKANLPEADVNYIMFTKGSPELILERCSQVQVDDQIESLTDNQRTDILAQNNNLAGRGLRVLGMAYRPLAALPAEDAADTTEQALIWLGLVGMLDAARPEAREAVIQCRKAGIRPVMITGDHQLTAQAIAHSLKIAEPGSQVLNGQQLEKLSPADLEAQVEQVSIYARVSPEHKLRIVQALQHRGEFVAMTGDGVNDAPALKQADIGVAMGITGTDVSKEASDMVLLDDNFATIVAATEEGRVVYTNIRRFVKYILGSNIGEVLTIAAAPILGLGGVPLTPLQILWMNLVTDGVPALALAVEPAEPEVMSLPPTSPRESIFARGLGWYMVRIGIVFAILSIILMQWAYNYTQVPSNAPGLDPHRWETMVFTTLCIAQMGHALAVRSDTRLTIELNPFSNPYVLWAVTLTTILQLMLIYVEPLRNFFGTELLSPLELAVCFGFSALMFVWIEAEKLFIRWYRSRQSGQRS